MFKKITIVLLFAGLYSSGVLFSQEVKWHGVEEAFGKLPSQPRKVFIDFYTDWCGWCKRMDAVTFSHPVIVEILNTYFYPIKFNAESSKDVQLGEQVWKGREIIVDESGQKRARPNEFAAAIMGGRMSFPSTAYMDEEGKLLFVQPGFQQPAQMELLLMFVATEAYKTKEYEEFVESYEPKIK
jgi:thioredoxin-related protein